MTKTQGSTTPISKPYKHKAGYRCRVRTPVGWKNAPTAPTEEAATLLAQQMATIRAHESAQTVGACIEKYLDDHRDRGTRARTIVTYRQHLVRFFGPVLEKPLGYVTPARAAGLYERRRTAVGERTGKPLAADTHRGALGVAKFFFAWCVEKRWLRVNPLALVKGVGSLKRGKAQPTIDEARVLWQTCLREAAQGDDGALAAAMALSMGLRAGEIVSRTVRDLDDKDPAGLPRMLRIAGNESLSYETKTRSSKRPILIPEELRGLLVERVRSKLPGALIFVSAVGRMNWVAWVNRAVHRLCKQAGIPAACAHALRGCSATTAAAAGATPQLVASMLGHGNTAVTKAHYIAPDTVETHQPAEGLRVLKGGR